ncbi:MAG: acetolactate synthase small subunit [Armatimonadota bacterium]|nr:acetolactate synthase small subunit [Armatimonadota bacterium]MDR7450013.1 acetolactate synthase small subunit [Armatimonadota bacterium]MDR7460190.1 acetolactate synthase small subunit [Armatimonadota bacterium]MDR7480727.1 acetolactate synthase small subunit [Armatimonadota bacterium]MDR7488927.1 acetolactate synthase small subunit [Armatimonadota bacterium]
MASAAPTPQPGTAAATATANGGGGGPRTLGVLVEMRAAVLERVAGLLRRRGYPVRELVLGRTEEPHLARLFVVLEEGASGEQVAKNLNKLVDVRRVADLSAQPTVVRELALIKVDVTPGTRQEVLLAARVFRARVVDMGERTLTLEVSGRPEKVDALYRLLRRYGVRELVRSGPLALVRGPQST